jgi:hypothetical protein
MSQTEVIFAFCWTGRPARRPLSCGLVTGPVMLPSHAPALFSVTLSSGMCFPPGWQAGAPCRAGRSLADLQMPCLVDFFSWLVPLQAGKRLCSLPSLTLGLYLDDNKDEEEQCLRSVLWATLDCFLSLSYIVMAPTVLFPLFASWPGLLPHLIPPSHFLMPRRDAS